MYSLCNFQYQHVIIHVQYLNNTQPTGNNHQHVQQQRLHSPLPFWDTCTVTQGGDSSLLTTQSGTLVHPNIWKKSVSIDHTRPCISTSNKNISSYNFNSQSHPSMSVHNVVGTPRNTTRTTNMYHKGFTYLVTVMEPRVVVSEGTDVVPEQYAAVNENFWFRGN